MSNLYYELGYSTGEFKVLQRIVFVVFGAVDEHLSPACWSTFLKFNFKQYLVCKF